MSSELRQVFVEVYVNGVFYCTESYWASDEQDVESEITSAIYDHFDSYKSKNIDVQLYDVPNDEVSSDEEDVHLEADVKDAISESVSLVSEELTDPAGSSEEEIDQDGTDASPKTSKENIPIEFAKVRKKISEFFRTGISPQPEAGSGNETSEDSMDDSPEIFEEDIPIDFAKVRKTISDFFRTGISGQPKTDLAVSESLCKAAGSSSEICQGGRDASPEISEEEIPIDYAKVRKTIGAFFRRRYGISAQADSDVLDSDESLYVPAASAPEPTFEPLSSTSKSVEPEMDPVNSEEWCISGSSNSELEPVSSEGLMDDIGDAISELKSQMLMSEDLTNPEGPSAEVEESSSGNNRSGTDLFPETAEEDIPTGSSTPGPTCEPLSSTPEPMEPELDLVNPEECCIPGPSSSEVEPVSSEGLVDDTSDAILEPRSPTLMSEDVTDPEGPSAEVEESSSGNNESGTDFSPETPEEDIPTGSSTPKPTCETLSSTPEPMEPELDLVNPEECCIPGPSSSKVEPVFSEGLVDDISDAIVELSSPMLVSEDPTDPEGPSAEVEESSSGNDQSGTDASPESADEDIPTDSTKVRKISKISGFFQKLFRISAQPKKDPALPEPPCKPEASVLEQEPQVTELSVLESCIPQNISQMKNCLEECTLSETPVTEVWPNVFLGNEEIARGRTKLREMGITHILNAAAVKKKLRVLMGMLKEKDLKAKINTGAKYYKGMNIKYCGLPTTHKDGVKMGMYFSPAAKFINKALRNPENKVLIHCCDGVSHSPTLLLAYLMIHHDMNVEEAIDHVTKVRHIKPSVSFLAQLMSLNAKLVEQRKQQLQDNKAAKCR
ncbi:hypothetical protein QQF64_021372 [Cirrhinus molitorella]|uniref:Uncharacterized protein n=1 Tax=Cirrhinus molitorella TaxID=172907 RepID=A0ABR3LBU8_9TELE